MTKSKDNYILFMDVDGVLIKSPYRNPACGRPWDAEIKRDLGIEPTLLSEHFFKKRFGPVLEGKQDLRDALQESFPDIGFDGDPDDIIRYWFDSDAYIDKKLMQYLQTIKRAGVSIYLATNQESMRAKYLWETLEFRKTFEGIFYSAEIGCTKKNPRFFQYVNKKLETVMRDKQAIFFDDQPKYVMSARKEGWNAFLYETIADFLVNPSIDNTLSRKSAKNLDFDR